jgi:hypothetical protein
VAANLQVKQLRRQCAVESTPHLRHGLALGVRLAAGLDACLRHLPAQSLNGTVHSTHAERRVLQYWTNVRNNCSIQSPSDGQDPDWIGQAWRAGPNHAHVSLTSILQCPVYDPEIAVSLTPLSHPDLCLSEQVRRELLRKYHCGTDFDLVAPLASDVDDESWLWTLPLEDKANSQRSEATAPLDQMLHGVQAFLKGQSSVEGVDTSNTAFHDAANAVSDNDTKPINLTVVVNMLHAALRAKSADELATLLYGSDDHSQPDPFFSDEDYNLMMPIESDEEEDARLDNKVHREEPHDTDSSEIDTIQSAMQAMDAELQASASMSRTWDIRNDVDDDDIGKPALETTADSHVALGAHVLTNLWQSMSDAPGGPGPVQNLLQQMHIVPHDICQLPYSNPVPRPDRQAKKSKRAMLEDRPKH